MTPAHVLAYRRASVRVTLTNGLSYDGVLGTERLSDVALSVMLTEGDLRVELIISDIERITVLDELDLQISA